MSYHRGSLYLIGRAPQHQDIRHWKVDRIEAADATRVFFNRPVDFDLHEHLAKSFGVYQGDDDARVKVRFSPTVRRYVAESSWHASQELSKQTDGSLVAEFNLSETEEIKCWIMSFGKHAVVLEPDELRQEMGEELEALVAAYGAGAAGKERLSAGSRKT